MSRQYFSDREWEAMFEAQGRKCCVPGCENAEGPFHGEHSTPNTWKNGKPDQIMCAACHKIKTAADRKKIAKADRLRGATLSQAERRRRFGSSFPKGRGLR